jgi:hypothetical protein
VAGYPVRRSRRVVFTQAFDYSSPNPRACEFRRHGLQGSQAGNPRSRHRLPIRKSPRLSQKGTHWKLLIEEQWVS